MVDDLYRHSETVAWLMDGLTLPIRQHAVCLQCFSITSVCAALYFQPHSAHTRTVAQVFGASLMTSVEAHNTLSTLLLGLSV